MKPDNSNILNRLKKILQSYAMEVPVRDYGRWEIDRSVKRYSRTLPKGKVKLVYSFPSTYMTLPFGGVPMIQITPPSCQQPIDITKEPNSPCCADPTGCQTFVVKVDKDMPYKIPPLGPKIKSPNAIWVSCTRGSSEGREQIICITLEDITLVSDYNPPR